MEKIKATLDSLKVLLELVHKDFKAFAFVVATLCCVFLLWFSYSIVNDLQEAEAKNDTSCDTKIEKISLANDIEKKILRGEIDTLRKTLYTERSESNRIILDMKNEQKEIYEKILKWKK